MKLIFFALILSVLGCARPTKIGDEKRQRGALVGAIQAYDDASAQNLTKREHRRVNVARTKVYEEKIRIALQASMNLSGEEKRALMSYQPTHVT